MLRDPFGNLRTGLLCFQQEEQGGGGQQEQQQSEEHQQQESQESQSSGDQEHEASQQQQGKAKTPKVYSERELRNAVSRELSAAEATLRASIRAEIQGERELEDAKSSGELSKVIEAHEKKLRDLEPYRTEVEEFRRLADVRFQAAFDGLPDSIKLFAPDENASALEKERWLIEKALPAAAKLGGKDPVKGLSNEDDPPKKQKKREDDLVAIRDGFATSGEYRPM